MKYRKLGRTGFEVSDIAYGLWGMSGWSGSDDQAIARRRCNSPSIWAAISSTPPGPTAKARATACWARSWRATRGSGCMRHRKFLPPTTDGPRCRNTNISDVFSAGARFQVRRPDSQEAARGHHRPAAVSRLGRQLDRRTGIPLDGGEAESTTAGFATSA